MHLDEETVQRVLHAELAPLDHVPVREHLAQCPDCRARIAAVERAEQAMHALFSAVDHSPPQVNAGAIAARARAHSPGWQRWAAGILLAMGFAGVAYAVPGSPIRAWVKGALEWMGNRPDAAPKTPDPAASTEAGQAGVAVLPGARLVILFMSRQVVGEARVTLVEGSQVVVRALTGAATFTSEVDRLVVQNRGSSATFEIQLPRQAPRVEIRVEGVRMFLKEGPNTHGTLVFRLNP